jgi:hypothetical protein
LTDQVHVAVAVNDADNLNDYVNDHALDESPRSAKMYGADAQTLAHQA